MNIDPSRRAVFPVKVLQFGEGNFLRGFVDWMVDILNEQTDFHGGVTIIQPIPQGMASAINEQCGLYHVWLNGLSGGEAVDEKRLITCVQGAVDPHLDYGAFLQLAELDTVELIVSNTTEAGIEFAEEDRSPDTLPRTYPGKLTALLYRRFVHFNGDAGKGLTVLPCELIAGNGDQLWKTVLQYASHWDLPKAFVRWIEGHVSFLNTLVDRIVPGHPAAEMETVTKEIGCRDPLLVKAEPFHLWIIEGPENFLERFPAREAGLEVVMVEDVKPYRSRKVRILNGAHTALVPVAYLRGLRTVSESVDDAEVGGFLKTLLYDEIIPTIDLPKAELEAFAAAVMERFTNPFIRHELQSIALNSISKFKVRVLPSILEYMNRFGESPEKLMHSLAALILYYRGHWRGETIPLNDSPEVVAFFKQVWAGDDHGHLVREVLSNTRLWGEDLTAYESLPGQVLQQLEELLSGE